MPSATSKTKPKHSWQFEAIGTRWSIETDDPLTPELRKIIAARIESFDSAYSRFRDDSLVASMASASGSFMLPGDGRALGEFYRQLYDATDGALSPLVGMSLEAAGYDKTYSFVSSTPMAAPSWRDAMTWRGTSLVTKQPVTLDVGAAGKGLLVDEIAIILEAEGVSTYVVDASGDIRTRGTLQAVGLENPIDATMIIGLAELQGASLCASATNRRKWGDGWHHVLDARTGLPAQDVVATWVIADTTMVADGLATALFFVTADKLNDIAAFQFVRLFANGKVEHSKGFMGELYV